ncbi:hypothetical protein GGX14DRAFT_349203 [Mycena pura]|uniref:Uncharacterized protein n=1 Tax=Mycena pura TaxID=153505 RepID=A0AAD7E2S2_9AGAR|nr:hypothetical protein GGX14DRAFT_349203 [Mycena pura]
MPNARPSLAPSASFTVSTTPTITASASTSTVSPARPLKRRLLSAPDLNFFVPAADSFKPLPYTPHQSGTSAGEPRPERGPARPIVSHALSSTLSLDPLPTDTDAVFLRYPFTSFPNQDLYPDGITYTALVENPSWFLVPDDYISENCKNPDAIPYPLFLEPPRGWCPAKKKDLKEKGAEVWPDGEQPRLRCAFCRRTYAGVNAKSMWRRHVFEKHKIAMSNRRNELERPRSRISNKENKRTGKIVKKEESHETIVNLDDITAPGAPVIPQGEFPPQLDISFLPASPKSGPVVPPASPYDPLLTPSFRHSPPRLPSDHPWRFTSPSHPLHRSRNVSLTMLHGESPITQAPMVARSHSATTPFSSPCTSNLGFETPENLVKIRPFPRVLFSAGRNNTPLSSLRQHMRTSSDVSDAWDTSKPLSLLPKDQNPFWADGDDDDGSPPTSSPEGESPVVRSAPRPSGVGLGILLEPFILPDSCPSASDVDVDGLIQLDEVDEAEVLDALMCSQTVPPPKRRRTSEGS